MSRLPHGSLPASGDPAVQQHLDRRRIWEQKYAIRACYRGWIERLRPFVVPGRSLEAGAGSGHLKTLWKELITSDAVATPFIDVAADAMRLPFADERFGNVLVIDLIHHLRDPHLFFDEAARVLRPGGRVLAIEPYITPLSYLGYRLMHHEDIFFGGFHRSAEKHDPWEGNLALLNVLFGRGMAGWQRRHPALSMVHLQRFSLLDFQLAGGFKPRAFVGSPRLYDWILRFDRRLDLFGAVAGFRVLCVIQKNT